MEHLLKTVRGFAATTIVAVVAALAVGVWIVGTGVTELDRGAWGQSRGHLTITKITADLSKSEAVKTLERTAARNAVNLALTVPDKDAASAKWDFFVFQGDKQNTSLERRPFDPTVRTTWHPASQIDVEDLVGGYATTATGRALDDVVADLERSGIEADSAELSPLIAPAIALDDEGRRFVALGTVIGLALALSAEALRRRRRMVVRRSCGWSRREAMLVETRQIATVLSFAIVAATGVTAMGLCAYNGFAGYQRFWPELAIVWGSTGFLTAGIHLALTAWPAPRHAAEILAGGRPPIVQSILPFVAQAALVSLSVGGLSQTSMALTVARTAEANLERQAPLAQSIRLGLGMRWGTSSDLDEPVGRIVREQLSTGGALLAGHNFESPESELLGSNYANGPDGSNILWTNHSYLRSRVASEDLRVGPTDGTSLTLLIPAGLDPERKRIEKEFHNWLSFQTEFAGVTAPETTVDVRTIRNDVVTPDFADQEDPSLPPRSGNVIAVLPDEAGPVSWTALSEWAGNGQILFTDLSSLRKAFEEAGISGSVVSYDRFGDSLHRQLFEARGATERLAASTVVFLVVLAAAIGMTVSHHGARRRTERRLLVLTGRSPWNAHGRFVATSSALTGSVVVLSVAASAGPTNVIAAIAATVLAIDLTTLLAATSLLVRADTQSLRYPPSKKRDTCPTSSPPPA